MKNSKHLANAVMILIIIISSCFVYGISRCNDDSMRPGIGEGDLVLTYKLNKSYFQNNLTVYKSDSGNQIRRVVAIEGDTVDITDNGLVINGYTQGESYSIGTTYAYRNKTRFPVTLKKGEVFLMADSREGASDSRDYGPVKCKDTKGVVLVVLRHRGL